MKLPDLDAVTFAKLLAGVSDLSLLLDREGVIQDVSVGQDSLLHLGCQHWIGRHWIDTVTPESRVKVEAMLRDAWSGETPRWRHINHPLAGSQDAALQYVVVMVESQGKCIAVARDLEVLADLQRRLVETQQAMERDYQRLRHTDARYRVLFEHLSESVLLVDGDSQKILEVNASAQALLKDGPRGLVGRSATEGFDPGSHAAIQSLIRAALASGRVEMTAARPLGAGEGWIATAVAFRQESGPQLFLRLMPRQDVTSRAEGSWSSALAEVMLRLPDAWLLSDPQGRVKALNDEAMTLLGLTSASQAIDRPVETWLSRGSVDWGVLHNSLRQRQPVRHFATEVRTLSGLSAAVDITAVAVAKPEPLYVFFLRDVTRPAAVRSTVGDLAGTARSDLAALVGRRPIKDIVGEAVDAMERVCIETALELTHGNRASAAEMLGLSRQSLYVKLRRFDMVTEADLV